MWRYTSDDHEFWCTLLKFSTAPLGRQNRYLQVDKSPYKNVVFQENRLAFEFEGVKNDFFPKKTKKKFCFLCLSVTMSWPKHALQLGRTFLIFPSIFLRPIPITIRRWGAVRSVLGRSTPHILFGWRKTRKWQKLIQVHETYFWCNRSSNVELSFERELNLHVFL